jgi:predicted nucleic acid-binding protein
LAEYVLADTSAVLRLTKVSADSRLYGEFLAQRRLATNFQIEAEVRNAPANVGLLRQQRCEELLAACLHLPNSEATGIWYGRVAQQRAALRKLNSLGQGAGDGDMWIVSSALEFGLPMMSHDAGQILLARSLLVPVFTALDGYKADNPSLPTIPGSPLSAR